MLAILNGALRNTVLTPRLGEFKGHISSTVILCAAILIVAWLTIGWVRPSITSKVWRALLVFGAISSCAAMVLACLYAYSVATQTLIITIPGMAMTHGLLNAFGFVTCSLLVWSQRVVDFPQ